MEWQEPWKPIQPDDSLVREAQKEFSKGHPLFGKNLKVIARRFDQDEVLFELVDDPPGVVVVHLTWSGKPEKAPFPKTHIYKSLEDFAENRMAHDAAIF